MFISHLVMKNAEFVSKCDNLLRNHANSLGLGALKTTKISYNINYHIFEFSYEGGSIYIALEESISDKLILASQGFPLFKQYYKIIDSLESYRKYETT